MLSAVGDCLLTALDFVAQLSHVLINGAAVEVEGERQDKPPTLTQIRLRTMVQWGATPTEQSEATGERVSVGLGLRLGAVASPPPGEGGGRRCSLGTC